jgi:hypothetical protein
MRHPLWRSLCGLWLVPLIFPSVLASDGQVLYLRGPNGKKNVIADMFEWTWDSIAAECTSFLGPAGYGFVQSKYTSDSVCSFKLTRLPCIASPTQEHIQGPQWWTDYQVSSSVVFLTTDCNNCNSQSPTSSPLKEVIAHNMLI